MQRPDTRDRPWGPAGPRCRRQQPPRDRRERWSLVGTGLVFGALTLAWFVIASDAPPVVHAPAVAGARLEAR